MLAHLLTKFEIQKYYQIEPKFNGVYSGNSLPNLMDVMCIINIDESKSVGTYWKAWYVNGNNGSASYHVIYFDGLELNISLKKLENS